MSAAHAADLRQPAPSEPPRLRHAPVLLREAVEGLQLGPQSWIIDSTLGGGGHTAYILEHTAPAGRVLGLDADPEAIQRVTEHLHAHMASGRLQIVHANFGELETVARQVDFAPVDAILFDLGVSSFQLETPERGFSFQLDGPLDMRFDLERRMNAADMVNTWTEQDLADTIFRYGEERLSRRIARYLVAHRPFHTTRQLAEAVERAVGGRRGRIHPATRTFQALRMAVNEELTQLARALSQCVSILKPGGRVAVIAFHSLEDRIVKQWMQSESSSYMRDDANPFGGQMRTPTIRSVTRKPITPDADELERNPRSRSAKLRIGERL